METAIKIDNISKTFHLSKKQMKINKTKNPLKVALKNFSLEMYKGEVFGLLGPNGAGKTTTLRILSTLIKADSGDCYIDGISVTKDSFLVRKKIGFLTSELKLEDFFTPNYLFDYFSKLYGIPSQVAQKRKEELFNNFGINEFKEIKIAELSTGMKQKVSLVLSLVHDPDYIIFDEPTNGLDVLATKIVMDFLLDLKKKGKTIILSTHIFSLVEKICDRVGIIIDGKIVKVDSLKKLTEEKNLEEVFFDIYAKEVKE